jgi:hypothetical protein
MDKTNTQFESAIGRCRDIFEKKMTDYGSAWRILRPSSLTDQIYIKANRIRSSEEKPEMKIDEGAGDEFVGIVNYAVMALIQLELGNQAKPELVSEEALELYNKHVYASMELMQDKNHDYDEAWRNMRISSYTDIILMKLLRIKQIENNKGKTIISEGLDANYRDIVNYALFALIKIEESNSKTSK